MGLYVNSTTAAVYFAVGPAKTIALVPGILTTVTGKEETAMKKTALFQRMADKGDIVTGNAAKKIDEETRAEIQAREAAEAKDSPDDEDPLGLEDDSEE